MDRDSYEEAAAEQRELAEDEAFERFEDMYGPFDDDSEDWRESSLTVWERNR